MKSPKKVYTEKLWGFAYNGKLSPCDDDHDVFEFHKKRAVAKACVSGREKVVRVTITYEV